MATKFKEFNPIFASLCWIIAPIGWVLFYFWNKGIKEKFKLKMNPVLRTLGMIVPVVNIIMFYYLLTDLKNKAAKLEPPEPWMAILLLVPIIQIFMILYLPYRIQKVINGLGIKVF